MKTFTIGEIYRMKLLKNHLGKPYKDKATISRVLKKLPKEEIMVKQGVFGPEKMITENQIKQLNQRFWKL